MDVRGFTALHYAVIMDNAEVAKLLLNAGANPNAASRQGYQPIHLVDSSDVRNTIVEAQGLVSLAFSLNQ